MHRLFLVMAAGLFVLPLLAYDASGSSNATSNIPVARPHDLAVNPKTNMIYVTSHLQSGIVSVIDGSTNQLAYNITVGPFPKSLDLNSETNRVYVAHNIPADFQGNSVDALVSVIDGRTNRIIGNISASDVKAVNSLTNRIYVGYGSNIISVVDGETNDILSNITLNGRAGEMAIDTKTNKLYTIVDEDGIAVINGSENKVMKTIDVGKYNATAFSSVTFDPDSRLLFVADRGYSQNESSSDSEGIAITRGSVLIINASTYDLAANVSVRSPFDIAVDPVIDMVYTTSWIPSGALTVVNGSTYEVIDVIDVGNVPTAIAVNPKTNIVYVVNSLSDTISVVSSRQATIPEFGLFSAGMMLSIAGIITISLRNKHK